MSNIFHQKRKKKVGRGRSGSSVGSASSLESEGSNPYNRASKDKELPPPVLVYHESAHSIVFRDHLRRKALRHGSSSDSGPDLGLDFEKKLEVTDANGTLEADGSKDAQKQQNLSDGYDKEHKEDDLKEIAEDLSNFLVPDIGVDVNEQTVEIMGYQPNIVPLPHLELGPNDEFVPLLASGENDEINPAWSAAEKEVFQMLKDQKAVVKTLKNSDWTAFLHRFRTTHDPRSTKYPDEHDDKPASEGFPFNSFVTSCSLLPSCGRKMRCYGAPSVYTTGVVFAMPNFKGEGAEDNAAERTRTWSWPSGYSAKTEFNIDSWGNLINGRKEALVPFSKLREYNDDYIHKTDYVVAGRIIKGGLTTVPYNEVFLRVSGRGRAVNGIDCATGEQWNDEQGTGRSFERGVGLPVALFVRTPTFGHLISLLRTRARLINVLGERHVEGIPLLLISPDRGVRVLTEPLQKELLKIAARNLNPFQNPMLAHKTTVEDTSETHLNTKMEELIDLDESIRTTLTPEECARLAGGFGATDESIAQILKQAMIKDKESQSGKNGQVPTTTLQDIVNEGLAAAVRSGDYYTSRQLLILYSLVASEGHKLDQEEKEENGGVKDNPRKKLDSVAMVLKKESVALDKQDLQNSVPPPPPPPPLDTDRLRSATNSDGLLAVLGAAQVLKAMRDGSAKIRTEECFLAVEKWVELGEQSMAFRLASWRDQRAAQGDLEIAFDKDSSFMAFVSNKAISNRKTFAKQLRDAASETNFADVRFLQALFEMTNRMHSPCLRLELLQYVLGLDNRYSIAHVKRSIELAATCMSISATL